MRSPSPLLGLPTMVGDLQRVETALAEAVTADDAFLTEVASHLLRAGGKRQRPAFAIVSARLDDDDLDRPAPDGAVMGAVSCELVHLGSLYHDDVMDEAITRRTVESVNARWGNLKAILAGDFLLARSSEIAASLGTEVAGLMAATISRLCEGQVRELQTAYDTGRTTDGYYKSISGKTAALFATACRVGGLVGDLSREHVETLTAFGHDYGMAFQIVDDILDVVATDEQLGKPSGHDIVEGVYTLPVLLALETPAGDELRELLGRPIEGEELARARKLVRSNGSVDESLVVARNYVDRAVTRTRELPSGRATDALADAAQALLGSIPSPS